MKPHLPALVILLLGAAFYLHRREAIQSVSGPEASRSSASSAGPSVKPVEPLHRRPKPVIEPPPQLVQRFEAELKARQPLLQKELRRSDVEAEISKWQNLLDWTAEQTSAVRRLATPRYLALADARHHGGLSAEIYQAGVANAKAALEEAMLQALGSEGAEVWRRASQRARERSAEDRVNASMRTIEEVISLEPGQKDRLHEALTRRATAEPTGPSDDSLVLGVTHDAGILPLLRDELVLAKGILTPEQMIQFDLAQQAKEKLSKIMLDSFLRMMRQFSLSKKPLSLCHENSSRSICLHLRHDRLRSGTRISRHR